MKNASSDVTVALRRTHQLMQAELSRSQFAQQTLGWFLWFLILVALRLMLEQNNRRLPYPLYQNRIVALILSYHPPAIWSALFCAHKSLILGTWKQHFISSSARLPGFSSVAYSTALCGGSSGCQFDWPPNSFLRF